MRRSLFPVSSYSNCSSLSSATYVRRHSKCPLVCLSGLSTLLVNLVSVCPVAELIVY